MLREYEFTVIARGDLADVEREKVLKKYEDILCRDGGELIRKDDWGVKKLTYSMKRQFRGHYTFYDIASSPVHIAETERLMRIDDNILRYMTIKTRDKANPDLRRQEIADAAKAKAEEKEKNSRD